MSNTTTTRQDPHANPPTLCVPLCAVERVLGLTAAEARERYGSLTQREREIAPMIAAGKPNSEIAAELGISVKTMDIHRGNIKVKLHARTLAQVANVVNLARIAE